MRAAMSQPATRLVATMTGSLCHLERDGLLGCCDYGEVPRRVDYTPTPLGRGSRAGTSIIDNGPVFRSARDRFDHDDR
ncbi:hypothetical protein [Sphingomonas sp. Leaf28]|uniref:hypothetical protein n=2 Tax=Sphingomonas TaxID=13687 RepID=UPI000700F1A1|nr:hypothetical protein [Sphingomonas sp. Leaf28]KQN15338.1 hypothetical protein ASE79_00715 [Sphingomonas sp. Leaf28]